MKRIHIFNFIFVILIGFFILAPGTTFARYDEPILTITPQAKSVSISAKIGGADSYETFYFFYSTSTTINRRTDKSVSFVTTSGSIGSDSAHSSPVDFSLTDVSPDSVYTYEIFTRALTIPYEYYHLSDGTFTTPKLPVALPGKPFYSNVGGDIADISMDISNVGANPNLTVMYSTSSDFNPDLTFTESLDVEEPPLYVALLSDLSTSTTYYFKVQETNSGLFYLPETGKESFTTLSTIDYSGGGRGGGSGGGGKTKAGAKQIVDTMKGAGGKGYTGKKGGLVECNGLDPDPKDPVTNASSSTPHTKCTFEILISMVNNIISFLIFIIAPIIMTGAIAYGGFMYLFSSAGASVEKGRNYIKYALIGWLLMMTAWLIVKFVMESLGYKADFPTFW